LFGFALSNKPANVPWAVLDWSQSPTSRRFVQEVMATGYFLPPRPVAGYAEGRTLLREEKALVFLAIPKSFRRDVERGRPAVQMLALPTTAIEIVLGKLVPYVGVAYALMLMATIAAGAVFGLWPHGSWLALLVVTLPYVLASLGIGVFVSALARTSAQAVFISVF